jgi:hypothetical protein
MKRNDTLSRYSKQARHWAFVKVVDEGYSPSDTVRDPNCIRRMIHHAELYQQAQRPLPGLEPPVVRPTLSAPSRVSDDYLEATDGFLGALASVGTLRGLYVVADGRGGYTATIKVTLPDGRHVYRYGRLNSPGGLTDMLESTILNDRWTPDKL